MAASHASTPQASGTSTAMPRPAASAAAGRSGPGALRSRSPISLPIHTTGCSAAGGSRHTRSSTSASSSTPASSPQACNHGDIATGCYPRGRSGGAPTVPATLTVSATASTRTAASTVSFTAP